MKKVKINLHEYCYSCAEGCCTNYGTVTTVNDVELPNHNQEAGDILEKVLAHLGYEVEINYTYNNDFDEE